jgi:hydrogenase maturation protein HypF
MATAPVDFQLESELSPRGSEEQIELRVRGRVQGVGFRPTVWRLARELGLAGEVRNDAEGVLIRLAGPGDAVEALQRRLLAEPPPLARIDDIESRRCHGPLPRGFTIIETLGGPAHTQVAPDAALCAACAEEVGTAAARRHRYAFTNCTHCGPRLSIVRSVPYDRAATTMAGFPLCEDCLAEYRDPADRRFHAEAIACPKCGPRLWLGRLESGEALPGDPVREARRLIDEGAIVAIKGLGGYQLACDATNAGAVAELRRRKHRDAKPFALMASDMAAIKRYCRVSREEAEELASSRAPIVLLEARDNRLPDAIAPGLATLGFMLPTTPLHLLLLDGSNSPLVMTSGNRSDEPQVAEDEELQARLGGIADYALIHDRPIANRIDDSVVRVDRDRTRVLRRARGFAPATIRLPAGFEEAPELLAMGGELKATFCLVKDGEAILSQHQGDLENPRAWDDYRRNLALFAELYRHESEFLAADMHPEYLSAKLARADGRPVVEVQHHHAHVAACLADNGRPLHDPPVLGIVLDGLGWGGDGSFWGGELLFADYFGFERLAALRPVAMPGGAQSVRQPWRNLYAHLAAAGLPLEIDCLSDKPLPALDSMLAARLNSPLASSCGRLFDAVAAALGICAERQAYEGEAAMRLEAIVDPGEEAAYPFSFADRYGLLTLEPAPMFRCLLADLAAGISASRIAARFHNGIAAALTETALRLAEMRRFDTIALSGGCLQNRRLSESLEALLGAAGFSVLTHGETPANVGGLALGQAAVAAARRIVEREAA